ncbi:Glycosyltransferase [Priestia megaterium]|uniref:glycosyltransferase n=1 Tax=Priestia megaterium TaxID=1404 RepID=UPI0015DBE75A|nr:glycosyltransferase [Priestia megaterium]MBD8114354.1 glycosyltransferase [Priestia megaterium]QLK09005.1 multidomain protein with s-layer homology region, glug motif, ig motif, i-set domain [Priestia megaterium]
MIHDKFLIFNGQEIMTTQEQLFTEIQNTFTIEFWAKPEAPHVIDMQSKRGIFPTPSKRFALTPAFGAMRDGNHSRAGIGISVGINGISIYEHTTNHLAPTLVFPCSLNDWTHIAVVYVNKRPILYINGKFAQKGIKSIKRTLVCSGSFGGMEPYGFYIGSLKEIRIWNTIRTQNEIETNMNHELTGGEAGLFGYWKINEGSGEIAYDSTKNKNNIIINGVRWHTPVFKKSCEKSINILFVFYVPSGGVETLNRQRCKALKKYNINAHCLYYENKRELLNDHGTPTFITNDDNEIKKILNEGNYSAIIIISDFQALSRFSSLGYQGKMIIEIQGYGPKDVAKTALKSAIPLVTTHAAGLLNPKTPHIMELFDELYPSFPKFSFNNCFDTTQFSYKPLPVSENPIIAWIGRIEDNKNWKEFLQIGSQLIKQHSSKIQLHMFEDPTLCELIERQKFEDLIKELNLENHLTLHANVPNSQMADHFSIIGESGGFLCSTSKVEGAPLSLLEAMSCKCPVLTTDSDGVRSSIIHNQTGKYYTLGDIDEATKEAVELMTNYDLRESIRLNGLKHVELHFSPDLYCHNFIQMLLSLGINYNK